MRYVLKIICVNWAKKIGICEQVNIFLCFETYFLISLVLVFNKYKLINTLTGHSAIFVIMTWDRCPYLGAYR